MYRFFVNKNQIAQKSITIIGSDVNHIKNVLRMKEGEEVSVVAEDDDNEYRCQIAGFTEDSVLLDLLFVKQNNVELPCEITLYQGLPKADKMELIIQKAVELGVTTIVPVATKRAVVKLEGGRQDKKVARWNSISEAAAKQAKRAIIPKVTEVMNFNQAIEDCKCTDVKIIPYELSDPDSMSKTRELIASIKPGNSAAIFIGPEGGFTEDEINRATEAGVCPITLGHRILRTETAGFTVLSWLVLQLEQ